MNLFLDHNLPSRVAHALHALHGPDGHRVVHLTDMFDPRTADDVWMRALASPSRGRWCVVTKDRNIQKNAQQRVVWKATGLTAFFLKKGWQKQRLNAIAIKLIAYWDDFVDLAEAHPGSGFIVPYRGKIRRVRL